MSAWDAFQKAADAPSAKEKTKCASLPAEMKEPPTFADRMNKREEIMKSRLESMEAVKPTLLALYDKLTPEQKAMFDRPMMGRHQQGGPGRHRRGVAALPIWQRCCRLDCTSQSGLQPCFLATMASERR